MWGIMYRSYKEDTWLESDGTWIAKFYSDKQSKNDKKHLGKNCQENNVLHFSDNYLFSIHTVSASIQFVHSIFCYEFLGHIQFKFCVFYSRILPEKWTFDQKMCIVLQFQQSAHSIQTLYCIETDTVDQLRFLCSDDTIKSLEQNDWLLNKSAILFWWFQLIIQNS